MAKPSPSQKPAPRSINYRADIGNRIADRRRQNGLTQSGLGEKFGVSRSMIGSIEQGISDVNAGDLPRLATILDVPVQYFFGVPEPERGEWHLQNPAVFLGYDSAQSRELVHLLQALGNDLRTNLLDMARSMVRMSEVHQRTGQSGHGASGQSAHGASVLDGFVPAPINEARDAEARKRIERMKNK